MEYLKVIILFASVNLVLAKIFNGNKCPTMKLKNISECVNEDFFNSQNSSNETVFYQVIARMEFKEATSITMFYTFFKENLVAVFLPQERKFSINCWSEIGKPQKTFFSFDYKFTSNKNCNLAIFDNHSNQTDADILNLKKLGDKKLASKIYFTKKKDYLAIWNCNVLDEYEYDLAAWILFSNTSMIVKTKNELRTHLKIFLRIINEETKLKFTESNFKASDLNLTEQACKIDNSSDLLYQTFKNNEEFKKNRKISKPKSSHSKFKFAFILLAALVAFIGIFFTAVKYITNRYFVSSSLNIL